MLPSIRHPDKLHPPAGPAAPVADFIADKSVFVAEVDDYDQVRSMLYALGARGVANKMMAHVNLIVHGRKAPPAKAKAKYPAGEFVPAAQVLARFHQEIPSFPDYVRALKAREFRVRNPSDEGDPDLDLFDLEVKDGSLHATLLDYLATSPFIRRVAHRQHFPIDRREDGYVDFPLPESDVTWFYRWQSEGWQRVSAQRGDGDYPLEIKGPQLLAVAPIFWRESAGLFFFEYPHIDSIDGLFIQAGIDARSGRCNGAAISRVWT